MKDQIDKLNDGLIMDKKILTFIQSYFKGFTSTGAGQNSNVFTTYLSDDNYDYQETRYYYDEEKEFFHLTSLSNLFLILNSETFRMYNLLKSKDVEEYAFAAKVLKIDEGYIKGRKENLFTFSFSSATEVENNHLWDTYGDKRSGVGICFSVMNSIQEWNGFHLSKIFYGDEHNFNEYYEAKQEFEKSNGIKISCDMSSLIGFHKSGMWSNEKERRILYFDSRNSEINHPLKEKPEILQKDGRTFFTRYVEMPLFTNRTEMANHDCIPLLKIKKIIFGKNSNFSSFEKDEINLKLQDIFKNVYGYEVEIEGLAF